jgi:hypothetical protein
MESTSTDVVAEPAPAVAPTLVLTMLEPADDAAVCGVDGMCL